MSLATKSCELDILPTSLFKMFVDKLVQIYTIIFNQSLIESKYPDKWKLAVIRPLVKKPGPDRALSNYRPVSNLNFTGKILER